MCLVSVILPNYNHQDYLKDRINSILNQSFQDFELIILDDSSTDNSREILSEYKSNPKVSQIIFNSTNSGTTFKQWRKGLEYANGSYIWIAESDDFSDLLFLERSINIIKENNQLSYVYVSSMEIDEASNKKGIFKWGFIKENIFDWNNDILINKTDFINKLLYCRNVVPNTSAVLFRNEFVKKIEWEQIERMKYAGDWLFWTKMAEFGDVYFINETLNYFRFHTNTTRGNRTTQQIVNSIKEDYSVIEYIYQKHKPKPSDGDHKYLFDRWLNLFYFKGFFSKKKLSCVPLSKRIPLILYFIQKKLNIKK